MFVIRWLSAFALVVLTAHFVHALAWRPFRCNILKQQAQRAALSAWNRPINSIGILKARGAALEIQRCIAVCPTDIDMYMTLAVNDRLIGRFEHAAEMYQQALQYERRPELYFNLAMVQLELGQRAASIANFELACDFDLSYSDEIPVSDVRQEVIAAVEAKRAARGTTNQN